MVMGHTPQRRIHSALGGKAWRIDVGASKGVMGGTPEVLEILHMGGEDDEDVIKILTVDGDGVSEKERSVAMMTRKGGNEECTYTQREKEREGEGRVREGDHSSAHIILNILCVGPSLKVDDTCQHTNVHSRNRICRLPSVTKLPPLHERSMFQPQAYHKW
jgi:hypothetical protein